MEVAGSNPAAPTSTGRFKSITIRANETPHAPEGHYSYVVTWQGQRLYFTGDTENPDQILAAGPVGPLFITPWLLRNSLEQGLKLPVRRIVIYHHDAGEPLPSCSGCTACARARS